MFRSVPTPPALLALLIGCACGGVATAQAGGARDTLLIDFGTALSPAPWNNLADPVAGTLPSLVNTDGAATGYALDVFDAFNNVNTAGTEAPEDSLGPPSTATGDSFFGNVAAFGGRTEPTGGVALTGLNPDPASAPLDTVLVDFGGTSTAPAPWNNVTDPRAGRVAELTNSGGFLTGYSVAVVDPFNNVNTAGTVTPDPALGFPGEATGDSFFGNVVAFGGQTEPTGAVRFAGLTTSSPYTFEIFASRTATDNRQTRYVVAGATTDTVTLDAASNLAAVATATVLPDADGSVVVTASPGPDNTNANGFYYLGAIRLTYPDEAPVGGTTLTLTAPNGGEFYQVGRTPLITWAARNLTRVALDYSTDAGASWTPIDTVAAIAGRYAWTVPNTPTREALVRVVSDSLRDVSDTTFEISSDTSSCTIVVIGSSTAEGTGASSPDSGWVARLRYSLRDDTRYTVVNLARGGYTTYHLLPTGTPIAAGVGIAVDEARNVTRALTYDPFAILVNLPSNDAARGTPVADQLDNFDAITGAATDQGVRVWVTTTQPRNFTDPAQIAVQRAVRDSILAIYGTFAVDFWSDLATDAGTIRPDLDAGDGTHVNDEGHRLLFERVRALRLDTMDCARLVGLDAAGPAGGYGVADVRVFPNPAPGGGSLSVVFGAPLRGEVEVRLVDVLGRVRATQRATLAGGAGESMRIEVPRGGLQPRQLFCVVTVRDARGTTQAVVPVVAW